MVVLDKQTKHDLDSIKTQNIKMLPSVCCVNSLDSSEGSQAAWTVQSPRTRICSWADTCTVPSRRLCQAPPLQCAAIEEKERTSSWHVNHAICCYWIIYHAFQTDVIKKTMLIKNVKVLCYVFSRISSIYLTQSVSGGCSWCFCILFL